MSVIPLVAPRGLRDLLPEASASMARLRTRVMGVFDRAGYGRVTTPAFEYAEVLERGLEVDRAEVVRFVEPETGEVALLRPDMTPQIARIVATRLSDRPGPYRLSYQGTVIRRKQGRARRSRMAAHAGVELIGVAGLEADREIVQLACAVVDAVALPNWRLELGQVAIARSVLDSLPDELRADALAALHQKDASSLFAIGTKARLSRGERSRLALLPDLYGGSEVLTKARRRFPEHKEHFDSLKAAFDHAQQVAGPRVGIDLGELRGHSYYTGLSFSLLADGPGAGLGGGGRYDGLVGRFGLDLPATGFGIDLDRLQWALEAAGVPDEDESPLRVVTTGDPAPLREGGLVACSFEGSAKAAMSYARAWSFDAVVRGNEMKRTSDAKSRTLPADWMQDTAIARWARPSS